MSRTLLLLRHAERPPIPPGTFGNDLEITPAGRREAEALGRALAQGEPVAGVYSSPVLRCVQTAEAMAAGAGWRHADRQHTQCRIWQEFYRTLHERPVPRTYRDLFAADVEVRDTVDLRLRTMTTP